LYDKWKASRCAGTLLLASRVPRRWTPPNYRGEIEIHTTLDQSDGTRHWYSYLVSLEDGSVVDIQRTRHWGQVIPLKRDQA